MGIADHRSNDDQTLGIGASGEIFWGSALANIHPGRDETWVNYDNKGRAPLLFISASADHLMPPVIQCSNA